MKKFIKIFSFSIILFLGFWFWQNLDFDSIFSNTVDTFKYEFSYENLSQSFEALNNAFSKRNS